MISIMKKRKLLLFLICCMGILMFPLSTLAASYSGYVGDEFTLVKPSVSTLATKIKDVTWSGHLSCEIRVEQRSRYLHQ